MSVNPDSEHNLSPSIVGGTPIDEIGPKLAKLSLAYCRLRDPAIGGTHQFDSIIDAVEALSDPAQGDQYIPGVRYWRVPQHRFAMEAMGLMAVIDLANTEDPGTFPLDSTAMTTYFGWAAHYIGQSIAVAAQLSSLDPVVQQKFLTDLHMVASGYDWNFRVDPGSLLQGLGFTRRGACYMKDAEIGLQIGGGFPNGVNRLEPTNEDIVREVARVARIRIRVPGGMTTGVKSGSIRFKAPRGFIFEQDDQGPLAPSPWELITQANTSESIVGAGTDTLLVTWDDTGGGGSPILATGQDVDLVQLRLVANNRSRHRAGDWVKITGNIVGAWVDFADADVTSQFSVVPVKVRSELR